MPNNVIEITNGDINALYALVSRAMEQAQVDGGRGMDTRLFVERLRVEAAQFAAQRMSRRSNPDCRVRFDANSTEYFVWALGLLTMDRSVEICVRRPVMVTVTLTRLKPQDHVIEQGHSKNRSIEIALIHSRNY